LRIGGLIWTSDLLTKGSGTHLLGIPLNANRLFVTCANRVGDGYLGRSSIVDTTGGVLAFGSATEEELISAEIDVERVLREKQLTKRSHTFGDRNPDVYEELRSAEAGKPTS
jgi:predicted amidohydrolase